MIDRTTMKKLDSIEDSFLFQIEEGVRLYVQAFRRAGLNTESSCHHDGYISIQCVDPTTERLRIFNVMAELGISGWLADLKVIHKKDSFISYWIVRSGAFIHPDHKNKKKENI